MTTKCVTIELEKITSNEPKILKDIFKAIIHCIFYHRAIGPIDQLTYANCDNLKITYAKCGDTQIEKDINEKWNEFLTKLIKTQKGIFTVEVEFYEKRKVKKYMFFAETDEDFVFEKWRIPFGIDELNKDNDDAPIRPDVLVRAEKLLNEAIMKIIENSNKHTDHLPDFNPKELGDKIAVYRYNILVGQEQKGILDMFKK